MPRAFRAPAQTPQRAPGRGLRTWGAAGLPGEKADTKAKGGGGHSVRGTGGGGGHTARRPAPSPERTLRCDRPERRGDLRPPPPLSRRGCAGRARPPRSERVRGRGEASLARAAQRAGARAARGSARPGELQASARRVPVCTATAPRAERLRRRGGRPRGSNRVPAGAPCLSPNTERTPNVVGALSGQRAARGGSWRRGLRRPREKRAPAPTQAIPACLPLW